MVKGDPFVHSQSSQALHKQGSVGEDSKEKGGKGAGSKRNRAYGGGKKDQSTAAASHSELTSGGGATAVSGGNRTKAKHEQRFVQ